MNKMVTIIIAVFIGCVVLQIVGALLMFMAPMVARAIPVVIVVAILYYAYRKFIKHSDDPPST